MVQLVCPRCKKEKQSSEFWKNNKVCITCNKEAWRKRITPEQREKYRERQARFDDLNIIRYLLRYARKRAKEKGLECTVKVTDIQLVERCPILGVPLVKNKGQW